MILLYTAVNVSLAVWLLKGFIDEIPREYEEAAMIDGYTRLQAFRKVVLPQAATGIAATAIFCLIFAWNEYAFAVLLTSGDGANHAAFHSLHHRRGRTGLAGGRGRHDDVSHPDRRASPSCCASICCAASPSGRCANDVERLAHAASSWPALAPSRSLGERRDGVIGLGVVMLMPAVFAGSLLAIPSSPSWPGR